MNAPVQPPARYRIRIRGHLEPSWSAWFDSLTVTQADDGTTDLAGPVADQAALFGLLARLRDLGATLLLVELVTAEPRQPGTGRCPAHAGRRSESGAAATSPSLPR